MITSQEIAEAAASQLTGEELREIIDCELSNTEFETSDLRLMLAADLICDAALEVVAQLKEEPSIAKLVALDGKAQLKLSEMSVVGDLDEAHRHGKVTMEELQALLLRSSVADAISNALEAGASMEDLAGGEIALSPIRLTKLLEEQSKAKGLFKRIFGRV